MEVGEALEPGGRNKCNAIADTQYKALTKGLAIKRRLMSFKKTNTDRNGSQIA